MSGAPVVVAGGGLAGISAALALADAGLSVTLLEARGRLGGATYSFQRDGHWFDNGQHVFLRCCTVYQALIERIGSGDLVTLQPRLDIPVIHPQRGVSRLARSALPAPLHLGPSLAGYRHLSRLDKLKVARTAAALSRLDLGDRTLDRQTFGGWLRKHGASPRALESLWDLIVLPTLNLPSDEASLWLGAMVFQVGLLTDGPAADLGYTTAPLGVAHGERAAAALAASGVDVRMQAAVSAIERPDADDLDVRVGGERITAAALILAVPHEQAARLVPAAGSCARAKTFADLGHSPIVNLHVIYDQPVMDHAFAAGVGTPLQWVFDRTGPAGLDEGQCLAVSLSAATAYADRPTEELRAMFLPELARLFPRAARARVTAFYATRDHRATFRPAPGTLRLRPQSNHRRPPHRAGRRMDRHRLARHDGGGGAQRAPGGPQRAAGPGPRAQSSSGGMSVDVSARPNALTNAIDQARRHLLHLQNPAGWWKGELESNVTIEAEDLFLRRYLGILGSRHG